MEKKSKSKSFNSFFAIGGVDITFLIAVIALALFGLVMLFSASYPSAEFKFKGDSTYYFRKQLLFVLVGLLIMWVISRIRYDRLKLFAVPALVGSIALLILVLLLPGSGTGDNFHRWIQVPIIGQFQPSEVAKFALILFCATMMERYQKEIKSRDLSKNLRARQFNRIFAGRTLGIFKITEATWPTLLCAGATVIFCALVMMEKHLSATILMASIGGVMMYVGGFKRKWFILILVPIIIGLALIIHNPEIVKDVPVIKNYMYDRIVAWLDKDFSPLDKRWQTNNALYAIGSGGFMGVGLGNSKQKHLYVSEPQNDMIFSIVCEEMGFVGACLVIALFAFLVWRGVSIGLKSKTVFGAFLAMGVSFQVGIQTILNIAVATDSMPNTGIGLPFFSYGGTSMIVLLAEMGVILAVSRYSRVKKK